uniref:Putative DnaB-like helicase C terminal domain protein n=1 Tax=uncultured marine microorganism HF4000_APKG7H23 TaxID=455551 RepID=B3T9S3_9ZZZZ|nr:putative DnaB-like helicase C terminal domain protein [uncultured marine microorganism HF4000_APKG7H23]
MASLAKAKTLYLCRECGHTSPRWEGRCPLCNAWDSYASFPDSKAAHLPQSTRATTTETTARKLREYEASDQPRVSVGLAEVDRLLGGGAVPGSLLLIAGEPGIGKSTLLLQMASHLAGTGAPVLYISGEESAAQVRLRAQRLGVSSAEVHFLAETNGERILNELEALRPEMAMVDSIQTLSSDGVPSAAGSVAQVRECTQMLLRWAKERGCPIFLAGHVTKDGAIAGPRVLEHMVDVVISLEGESLSSYRLLRCTKNRFGATNDVALLEMRGDGMAEVPDPSAVLLGERQPGTSGSAVTVTLEGTRPLMAEVQALTNPSLFSPPRRTANGMEFSRVMMIAAVLGRRGGVNLGNQDLIVSVAGGLRIREPAADLATALSIASSLRDIPLDSQAVVLGEVGLNGEVRSVPQLERRLVEAVRHGFTRALVPKNNALGELAAFEMEVVPVVSVQQAMECAGHA